MRQVPECDLQKDRKTIPMSQSQRMVAALKASLRERRVSYEQVAAHLQLSLSSVKRLFASGAFTLQRLEAVCDLAGIDMLELARNAEAQRARLRSLTATQEQELVGDPLLLLVAICVLNRWSFEQIVDNYRISRSEAIVCLAHLDRIGLVELLPGNRIKLRIDRDFAWLHNGPIYRYFVDHVQSELLSGEFRLHEDLHRFSWGLLTRESVHTLQAKIEDLVEAFNDLTHVDEVLPQQDQTKGNCLLIALREWEPENFRAMRRTP